MLDSSIPRGAAGMFASTIYATHANVPSLHRKQCLKDVPAEVGSLGHQLRVGWTSREFVGLLAQRLRPQLLPEVVIEFCLGRETYSASRSAARTPASSMAPDLVRFGVVVAPAPHAGFGKATG